MYQSSIHCRRFAGKTALVTGASSGIGRATAERLAAEGASLVLVARRDQLLEEVRQSISVSGGKALAVAGDITSATDIERVMASATKQFGKLDVLVNAVGQELLGPLHMTKPEQAQTLVNVNMMGVMNVCRLALKHMATGGAIVNIASVYGVVAGPALTVYSMTKGAVIAFSRSLAAEVARRGIRVNCVSPGMVKTDLLDRSLSRLTQEQAKTLEGRHLLGFGKPEDVAAAVAFLTSDDGKWVTGSNLIIDGGFTC